MEKVTEAMKQMLDKPLPPEAIKPHPTKSFLSTINSIYVTERLNEVFGVGQWQTRVEVIDAKPTKPDRNGNVSVMVVTKTTFEVPGYGIHYECFGGNDNDDLGDAYKGAVTDAITKIGSWLGIGADVWKDKSNKGKQSKPATTQVPPQVPPQVTEQVPAVEAVIKDVYKCKTVAEIEAMFRKYPIYKKDDKLIAACRAAKSFLENPKNTKQ